MKIAKKVIIALAVIILLVIAATFISIKYEENKNEIDQIVAIECTTNFKGTSSFQEYDLNTYYLLESSPKSRSTRDFYKAVQMIYEDFIVPPLGTDIDEFNKNKDYFMGKVLQVVRTNKYIVLFETGFKKRDFKTQQDALPFPKEFIDEVQDFPSLYNEKFNIKNIQAAFNRETLERVSWYSIEPSNPNIKQCKEVDPLVPLNKVRETEKRAINKEKKI